MLAIKEADKTDFWSDIHTYTTQDNSVKLTHPLMFAMERADNERNMQVILRFKHPHIHNTIQYNSPPDVGNGVNKQEEKQVNYFWSNTHIHKIRQFSKTHPLMLVMERADKERNRLLLVKHSYIRNTRPFSKLTH